MRRLNGWRWRLARWIAPVPIVARPEMRIAIYMGGSGDTVAWLYPKTLDVKYEHDLDRKWYSNNTEPLYAPRQATGTISGTL